MTNNIAQTPEAVALELYYKVAAAENKQVTKEYILSTYVDCLRAVRGTYGKTGAKSDVRQLAGADY